MYMTFNYEIKICEENRELIWRDIQEVEGKATFLTIRVDDVFNAVIETETLAKVPENMLIGSTADVDVHGSDFWAKRKQIPDSTQFTITRKADGWYLVNIRRASVRSTKERYNFDFPKAVWEEIKKAIFGGRIN